MQVVPSLHFGGNTYQADLIDRYTNKELSQALPMKLRIMVRRDRSEVYVNDRWIFNVGFKELPPKGGFSILTESGGVEITNLEIHELEPLP